MKHVRLMSNIALDRVRNKFYDFVVVSCLNKWTIKTLNNVYFKVNGVCIVG